MKNITKKIQSNTSRKKMAFVYDAIYPYIKGGGERRYFELANRLSKKNYEVHLYGMKLWKGPDVIKKDEIYLHGICSAKPLYTKDGKRSIWQAIYFGINCLKLMKEDFDIIDCCGFPYFSLFSCKLVTFVKRKKLYSTYFEVWGKYYWKNYIGNLWFFGYFIERLSKYMPNEIIAISKFTAQKIRQDLHFRKKILVVPNGIDIEEIRKIKPNKIKSDVIYAGRLMSFKHIDILIKAIQIIKANYPSITLIIIGGGPEKDNLVNLTRNLRLQDNVKFKGFLKNHDDVYSYMKSSKVFVLPSTREGFGMVVLEANACGIPVITVNHRDNAGKDLIKEKKNGFVADFNEKSLAIKILRAIRIGRSMKENCLNEAKKYDWKQIINKLEEVYK